MYFFLLSYIYCHIHLCLRAASCLFTLAQGALLKASPFATQFVAGRSPPRPPLAIITDKVVGLSYPKFALLAMRGLVLKASMEEQRTILARKTYALDTAWWRGNSRIKLAKNN